mmetsp:Transcript_9906/g.28082  ORF Transcript_9906/g.28082 Transcript_9906/m.28082 type:complete len:242 (-) Transcript_9906:1509-2234(-)
MVVESCRRGQICWSRCRSPYYIINLQCGVDFFWEMDARNARISCCASFRTCRTEGPVDESLNITPSDHNHHEMIPRFTFSHFSSNVVPSFSFFPVCRSIFFAPSHVAVLHHCTALHGVAHLDRLEKKYQPHPPFPAIPAAPPPSPHHEPRPQILPRPHPRPRIDRRPQAMLQLCRWRRIPMETPRGAGSGRPRRVQPHHQLASGRLRLQGPRRQGIRSARHPQVPRQHDAVQVVSAATQPV